MALLAAIRGAHEGQIGVVEVESVNCARFKNF